MQRQPTQTAARALAVQMGTEHGNAGTEPYGDLWDAGSAALMRDIGETGPTTEVNWPERLACLLAYEHAREVARHATAIMAEVDRDIAAGIVPASVASVTGLHEHVDANDYTHGVPLARGAERYALVNDVMAEVDRRLACRGGAR